MRGRSGGFRLTTWLAAGSLATASLLAGVPVRAQDAAAPSGGDPPTRVGRLSRLLGSVSTHGADATEWSPAVLNFPVAAGDSLWTQPQAQADIELDSSIATLADQTELDIVTLDDQTLVASEPQGAIFLDLRDVRPGETFTVNTPRGAAQIAADGEYEILAGDTGTPTRLAVVRGAAQFTSGSLALRAGPGQMAVVNGDQDVQGDVEPLSSYDPFLTAMLARNSPPVQEPEAVQGMTGAEGLSQYGAWQNSPEYGQVWYPQVGSDWVPYRDGSWAYVEPWGWTWVDSEPWGFAPFHYGRWAQLDGRWGWVPGGGEAAEAEPAYAPALVDFVVAGAVAGAAAGLLASSLGSGRGDIGWVPLGPHEAYQPPYGGSGRYLSRLNPGHGWRRPEWGGDVRGGNAGRGFLNRHAVSIAPAAAMAHSQPMRRVAYGLENPAAHGFRQAGAVQPLRGALPIRPVAQTRGLTPQAAQRLGVARAPGHAGAPGPTIAAGGRAALLPGGRIPLRGAGATGAAARRPAGNAPAPGPVVRPGGQQMPGLRPHEAAVPRPTPAPALAPARPAQHAPAPLAHRFEPPRAPSAPTIQAPRAPLQRTQAPAIVAPRAPAPRIAPPRVEAPRIQAPRIEAPRPSFRPQPPPRLAQPQFAPRPAPLAPGPAARPVPHPAGAPAGPPH